MLAEAWWAPGLGSLIGAVVGLAIVRLVLPPIFRRRACEEYEQERRRTGGVP